VRYLVLSDIHANLQALDAVLEDARTIGFDATVCLGDLVGYGAEPGEVIARVQALAPVAMVRGNHDKVCAGLEPPAFFNEVARASVEWTRSVLTPAETAMLAGLPRGPIGLDSCEVCHGSPADEDGYVFDVEDAARAIAIMTRAVCLFGHTHVPTVLTDAASPLVARGEAGDRVVVLPRQAHTLVNVGAVGQPRDGDPRAAYGIWDDQARTIRMRRARYDVKTAQQAILSAGLPTFLALRLERGQ
jgi:diadenosine tetraphosphatase ApaH/serine/threonine PP2A family protein phosphatase